MTNFSSSRHLPALDGVRGLAIVLVMIHHLGVMVPATGVETFVYHTLSLGWAGVELFFVLSGFLITGILLDTKGSPHFFQNFYVRRVLRIFPLFYAIAIFSFIILPHLPLPATKAERFGSVGGDQWYYWVFLSNIAIAKAQLFRHGVMDVTWSVAIEEQFYLLWPALVLLLRRRSLAITCAAIVLLSPIARAIAIGEGMNLIAGYVMTPLRMDGLAAGALLAILVRSDAYSEWLTLRNAAILAVLGVVLFWAAVVIGGGWDIEVASIHILGFSGFVLLFSGVLIASLRADPKSVLGRFFSNGALRFFGKYSYCLYLIHLPIRAAVRDLWIKPIDFHSYPGGALVAQLIFYVVAGGIAVAVAFASYHLFEKQFLKLKRYFPSETEAAKKVAE